jgi:phospholipid transport system substrate-binding protein
MKRSHSRIRATAALVAALAATGLAGPATAERTAPSAAVAFVSRTVDDVLEVLKDASLSNEERLSRIEQIAYDRFDFPTMSRLVVARYWKRFTPAQQEEFIAEFKIFLSRTYGDRIERYSDEQVEVIGERQEPRGDVTVLTRIAGGEYDGALVDYRLRQSKGHWRVIDVKVEGISLVLNYRDQFKSLLSRGGPEELLEKLREKNAAGEVQES